MRKIVFFLLLFVSLSHSHLKAAATLDFFETLRVLKAAMAPSLLDLRKPRKKSPIEVVTDVYRILNTSGRFECGEPVSLKSFMWETFKESIDGTTSYKIRSKPEYSFSDALDDLLERGGRIGQTQAELIAMAMVQRELSGFDRGWWRNITLDPCLFDTFLICFPQYLFTFLGQFTFIPLPYNPNRGVIVFCCKLDKSGGPLFLGFGPLFRKGEPRKLIEILYELYDYDCAENPDTPPFIVWNEDRMAIQRKITVHPLRQYYPQSNCKCLAATLYF